MLKRLKVQMIKIDPFWFHPKCCLLNGAKRQSRSSGICLHEFSTRGKATFSMWLLSTSPRTLTPVTCSQPDPVVVWREWSASGKSACSGASPRLAAALRGLRLVPPEKALAIAPLCWRHFGQTHPHQQPAWGHFTTFFLLLLTQTSKHTGPWPYMALSAYTYVMAILVFTLMFLKLDWDVLTTCWTQRRPRGDGPPESATHNGRK